MGCSTSALSAVSAQSSMRCDLSDSLVCNPRVQAAIEQFNGGEPAKAIASLGLADEPEAAAAFLHRTPALDTTVLGEMLTEPKSERLMRTYVQWLDLSNLTLDVAMRRLLRGFRLPGEAQKIDRIMDAFAEHWLTCQAEAGPLTTDTAFLMSFALIMLNSDLHNPSVKRKMSLPQFQSNLRGVSAGQDLPGPFVAKLYENVKREEFCLNSRLTGSSGRSSSRSNLSESPVRKTSSAGSESSIMGKTNSAAIVPDLRTDTLTRLSTELSSRRISSI